MAGRIEAHFHIFGSLALLSFYRDPKVFIPAVGLTLVDHLFRGVAWPQSVYGVMSSSPLRTIEHGVYIAFETAFLVWGVCQGRNHLWRMSSLQVSLEDQRDRLDERVNQRTAQLAEARDYFASVLDSLDAQICILDSHGTIISTNKAWQNFATNNGATTGRFGSGTNYLQVCRQATGECAAGANRVADAIERVIAGKSRQYVDEYPCQSPTEKRWFQVRICPFSSQQKAAVVVSHVDITDRVLAYESAAEDAQRANDLATIIREAPYEIYLVDCETRTFVEVSQGSCDSLEYDRDELLTMRPHDIRVDIDDGETDQLFETLLRDDTKLIEFTSAHRKKSGKHYPIHVALHAASYRGRPTIVAFITNLTQVHQLEMRLTQAQKLESIGQLAAGIAHEINTPMQCVSSNLSFLAGTQSRVLEVVQLLSDCLSEPNDAWMRQRDRLRDSLDWKRLAHDLRESGEAVDEANEASNRVIEIVRAMKSMCHPGTQDKVVADINQLIRQSTTITRNSWKYAAVVDLDLADDLPPAFCYPAELSQVFINMLVNAADAILETDLAHDGRGLITIRTRQQGENILVEIADNGPGIPEDIGHRIFDPFFTTKEVGKGTGQGLAIAYDIVNRKHNGRVDFVSTPGHGTIFSLTIPHGNQPTAPVGNHLPPTAANFCETPSLVR
jgi:PAS domain S-box-containing protein